MNEMFWMGKPINDLPRDELLKIIRHMAAELDSFRSPQRIRAFALGSVEMIKRGERRES
jgi:hypothetical protein